MFGYFRFNPKFASAHMKRAYKNYYCGTCFALEYAYGELPRVLLSYDVVILGLIAKLIADVDYDPLLCFFTKRKKKIFIEDEQWRKLAAINLFLFKAKIDDDLNDELSPKAKVAAITFSGAIKKATSDYPLLAKMVDAGYKAMFKEEQAGSDVLVICETFANMMVALVKESYHVDENYLKFVHAISRWLYFIDQLDDYDDDIREGKYNPLIIEGVDKAAYINYQHERLFRYLADLFSPFDDIKRKLDRDCVEDRLLYSLLNESIPNVTSLVLSNRELPRILHRKKTLEWSE